MWWARRGAGLPTAHGPAGGAVPGHGGTATTRSGHRAAAPLLTLRSPHPLCTVRAPLRCLLPRSELLLSSVLRVFLSVHHFLASLQPSASVANGHKFL